MYLYIELNKLITNESHQLSLIVSAPFLPDFMRHSFIDITELDTEKYRISASNAPKLLLVIWRKSIQLSKLIILLMDVVHTLPTCLAWIQQL